MQTKNWKLRFDTSQAEYLPLIANCLLGVQILSTVRDAAIIGLDMPIWLAVFNVFLIAVMISMAIWVQTREIPDRFSHHIVMAAMLFTGAKAVAIIAVQAEPLPFYMAIFIFSCSLCFLSYRILLLTSALVISGWAVVVPFILTTAEIISTFVAMVMAVMLSVVVLRRRIYSLVHVYELEERVVALETILPMCASCKKTRDHLGNWKRIEEYVQEQKAGLLVSHGICPGCSKELYGDYLDSR